VLKQISVQGLRLPQTLLKALLRGNIKEHLDTERFLGKPPDKPADRKPPECGSIPTQKTLFVADALELSPPEAIPHGLCIGPIFGVGDLQHGTAFELPGLAAKQMSQVSIRLPETPLQVQHGDPDLGHLEQGLTIDGRLPQPRVGGSLRR
jgi:hypothetical protein